MATTDSVSPIDTTRIPAATKLPYNITRGSTLTRALLKEMSDVADCDACYLQKQRNIPASLAMLARGCEARLTAALCTDTDA